jgi:hypothetical protein
MKSKPKPKKARVFQKPITSEDIAIFAGRKRDAVLARRVYKFSPAKKAAIINAHSVFLRKFMLASPNKREQLLTPKKKDLVKMANLIRAKKL